MENQQRTEVWRVTRLGARYLSAALAEISKAGSTGSLTIHFYEGKAGSLEFREKQKSTEMLDNKRS